MQGNPILALLILSPVVAFIVWLQVGHRREMSRRAKMPPEYREILEQEDATWQQTYGL